MLIFVPLVRSESPKLFLEVGDVNFVISSTSTNLVLPSKSVTVI